MGRPRGRRRTQSHAVRGRHLVVHQFLGQPRAAGRDPEPDSGHRAARPRRHARRADLPRAGEHHSNWQNANVWRASASYVTGANAVKIGYQGGWHISNPSNQGDENQLDLPVQQRRAEPADDVHPELEHGGPDPVPCALRPGPVVARAPDAPGRGALRPCRQLGTRGRQRLGLAAAVLSGADCVSAHRQRHRLQRHHLPRRSRLERVRRRQDVGQAECRQVPAERQQPGPLHAEQPGAGHAVPALDGAELERPRSGLRSRLRVDDADRQWRVWRLARPRISATR